EDAAPSAPVPLIHGTETILLVEDDTAVRELAHRLLTDLGYDVIEAERGPMAVSLAAKHNVINLLVTDVIMPEMSGKQVYEQVAALHPGIKVIYMSGYTADVIAHRGILDDGVHLLQKPFTLQNLAQKVNEVLAG
ncbi:MAG: response regulator, partial [Candidatus Hydrogenedentes bacterium]|nr:response regulator [Candidatus Hydrogenedentota bacterium]